MKADEKKVVAKNYETTNEKRMRKFGLGKLATSIVIKERKTKTHLLHKLNFFLEPGVGINYLPFSSGRCTSQKNFSVLIEGLVAGLQG